MSSKIASPRNAMHPFTDEMQNMCVIQPLLSSWEIMKQHLTHNESISIIADIGRHRELEDERIKASQPLSGQAFATESSKISNLK